VSLLDENRVMYIPSNNNQAKGFIADVFKKSKIVEYHNRPVADIGYGNCMFISKPKGYEPDNDARTHCDYA
jgi:hypothetical protein